MCTCLQGHSGYRAQLVVTSMSRQMDNNLLRSGLNATLYMGWARSLRIVVSPRTNCSYVGEENVSNASVIVLGQPCMRRLMTTVVQAGETDAWSGQNDTAEVGSGSEKKRGIGVHGDRVRPKNGSNEKLALPRRLQMPKLGGRIPRDLRLVMRYSPVRFVQANIRRASSL